MKILHVITTMGVGGAERLIVDLLPRLCDCGNEVELLLFNGVDTPFKEEIERLGINVKELSRGKDVYEHWRLYNPLNIFKLMNSLKGYDIIHTHNTACQLYVPMSLSLMRLHTTLVTTEHSTSNRRRNHSWLRPLDKWMYNKYAAIVCVAEKARKNLVGYVGSEDRTYTINNGIDISRFIRPIKDISNNNCYVITMVAGLREEKDHATVLRAMTKLPQNYILRFVGVGSDECEESVRSMCTQLGLDDRVTFMGARSDIPNILEQSDILLLSSHWEGLSLSSIEGMASGRPFIASDVDGLREMVGGAGVLFPHGDELSLAREIIKLCEDKDYYRSVAEACQERAKRYDITGTAVGYDKLYKLLLKSTEE